MHELITPVILLLTAFSHYKHFYPSPSSLPPPAAERPLGALLRNYMIRMYDWAWQPKMSTPVNIPP